MNTTSVVYERVPHYNAMLQLTDHYLRETGQRISSGLVARLERHARRRLSRNGFDVTRWPAEVYSMDANLAPSDRTYGVEFTNPAGAKLKVVGILTVSGYPTLDHGVDIEEAP